MGVDIYIKVHEVQDQVLELICQQFPKGESSKSSTRRRTFSKILNIFVDYKLLIYCGVGGSF